MQQCLFITLHHNYVVYQRAQFKNIKNMCSITICWDLNARFYDTFLTHMHTHTHIYVRRPDEISLMSAIPKKLSIQLSTCPYRPLCSRHFTKNALEIITLAYLYPELWPNQERQTCSNNKIAIAKTTFKVDQR